MAGIVFINIRLIMVILLLSVMASAQQTKTEFQKTVDSINAILKTNKLAYYTNNKQNSAFIRQINLNRKGIVTLTDSIPKPESTTTKQNKSILISDCCPEKTIRTLDLSVIKKWEIQFPYIYLKDKNNQTYGRIIGIRKADVYLLKEQFEKLTTLCRKQETKTKF